MALVWKTKHMNRWFSQEQKVGVYTTPVACDPIWVFPKIVVPQNGWFIMENPIKMDDLGVPLFSETPIWHVWCFSKLLMQLLQGLCTSSSRSSSQLQAEICVIPSTLIFVWCIYLRLPTKLPKCRYRNTICIECLGWQILWFGQSHFS